MLKGSKWIIGAIALPRAGRFQAFRFRTFATIQAFASRPLSRDASRLGMALLGVRLAAIAEEAHFSPSHLRSSKTASHGCACASQGTANRGTCSWLLPRSVRRS